MQQPSSSSNSGARVISVAMQIRHQHGWNGWPRRGSHWVAAGLLSSFVMGVAACASSDGTPDVDAGPGPPQTGPCDCGTFAVVGETVNDRYSQTALVLEDASVLVAGGNNADGALTSVERYNPSTNTTTVLADLPEVPRFGLALHALADGRVLAAYSGSSVAILDVGANVWSAQTPARLGHNRAATVLIDDALFLVAGASFPFVDRFDLDTGTWTELPNLRYGRESHTATLLDDGRILIVGGYDSTQFLNQGATEVFDPQTGVSEEAGRLEVPRQLHTAVRLHDGRVLVAGGFGPEIAVATAVTEVFDPEDGAWSRVGDLPGARVAHTLTVLDDGTVLVAGGLDPNLGAPYSTAALFFPETGVWRELTSTLLRPRQSHAAVALDTDALLFGGNEAVFSDFAVPNHEVERFSP